MTKEQYENLYECISERIHNLNTITMSQWRCLTVELESILQYTGLTKEDENEVWFILNSMDDYKKRIEERVRFEIIEQKAIITKARRRLKDLKSELD